jgi:hypothetical protein
MEENEPDIAFGDEGYASSAQCVSVRVALVDGAGTDPINSDIVGG